MHHIVVNSLAHSAIATYKSHPLTVVHDLLVVLDVVVRVDDGAYALALLVRLLVVHVVVDHLLHGHGLVVNGVFGFYQFVFLILVNVVVIVVFVGCLSIRIVDESLEHVDRSAPIDRHTYPDRDSRTRNTLIDLVVVDLAFDRMHGHVGRLRLDSAVAVAVVHVVVTVWQFGRTVGSERYIEYVADHEHIYQHGERAATQAIVAHVAHARAMPNVELVQLHLVNVNLT